MAQSTGTCSLLVFESIPEKTDFYLIPNTVADPIRNFLEAAHNKFINADEMNDGLLFLNAALSTEDPETWNEEFRKYVGMLTACKVDNTKPITGVNITAVYLSGFVL